MTRPTDNEVARRWMHRIRFVLDEKGDVVPEWRYPELVPSRIRETFESRVRAEGPSLGLVAELERLVLEAASRLVEPGTPLEKVLDQKGFTAWPFPERGLQGA